jgi:hypothetical protein
MQVLVDEREYRQIARVARLHGMTVAEWVRQTLRAAVREEPVTDRQHKLAVIRAASKHAFPTGDIEQMLAEIDRGYAEG